MPGSALGILSENLLATAVKGECKSGAAVLADYNFHSTAREQEFVRGDSQTYVRIASANYPSRLDLAPATLERASARARGRHPGINFYGTETFLLRRSPIKTLR